MVCAQSGTNSAHASEVRTFCSITFPFSGLHPDEDVRAPDAASWRAAHLLIVLARHLRPAGDHDRLTVRLDLPATILDAARHQGGEPYFETAIEAASRVTWVRENVADVLAHIGVATPDGWQVRGMFVVDEPLFATHLRDIGMEVVSIESLHANGEI